MAADGGDIVLHSKLAWRRCHPRLSSNALMSRNMLDKTRRRGRARAVVIL